MYFFYFSIIGIDNFFNVFINFLLKVKSDYLVLLNKFYSFYKYASNNFKKDIDKT